MTFQLNLRIWLKFTTVVLIALSCFKFCNCMSREFFQLTLNIQNHSNIFYITDAIPDTIPRKFCIRYQFSHVEQLKLNSTFLEKLSKLDSHSTKFIISYPTVQETIQVISDIGSSPQLRTYPLLPWILALWPQQITDTTGAIQIIQDNLVKPAENITINQQLYIAFRLSNSNTISSSETSLLKKYIFYELYTINHQLIYRQVENLGRTIVQVYEGESLTARRFNLHGVLLRLEGVKANEFNDDTIFTENDKGEIVLDNCLAKKLTEIMMDSLNFTAKLIQTDEWGKQLPNGTWVGAIKDVVDEIADIGITSTTMLKDRGSMVGFLPPNDEYIISAFFRPPSLNAIRDIFMQPFQPTLWAAVVSTWLALASAMVMFTLIRKKFGAHNNNNNNNNQPGSNVEEHDFTNDSLIWALATVCQQGWDEHPQALSLRAIFISASFTGVIAYAGYSAAIVSTLSLRIDPIQSPEALIESNLRLGLRNEFLSDVLLQSSQNESASKVGDIIAGIKSKLSKKPEEAFVNVTTGTSVLNKNPYAFIGAREGFYDILKQMKPSEIEKGGDADTQICSIKELQILKQSFKGGMFTRKLFPFREFFRLLLLIVRERGILWRLRSEFTYNRRCLETTDNSGRALGAADVFTAFMVLTGGYFLSTVFLAVEKIIRFNSVIYIR